MSKNHYWHTPFSPAKKRINLILALILALVAVNPVAAGNWAVINLHTLPGEIIAGEPLHLEFTVLQHGETPVHTVFEGQAVKPYLVAANPDTGETLRVEAVPAKETGRFTLDVTFPSAGTWDWSITPDPLIGETSFSSLKVTTATVSPAGTTSKGETLSASPAPALPSIPAGLRTVIWPILVAAGLALSFIVYRSWQKRDKSSAPAPGA